MTTWLAEFYLGLFLTWLAVSVWERLQVWWAESKQDLTIEYVEPNDLMVQPVERRTL